MAKNCWKREENGEKFKRKWAKNRDKTRKKLTKTENESWKILEKQTGQNWKNQWQKNCKIYEKFTEKMAKNNKNGRKFWEIGKVEEKTSKNSKKSIKWGKKHN